MVLVATYMEVGTICRLVEQLRQHLPEARILIVDDQSPDGTAAQVRRRFGHLASVEVVSRPGPRGYSAAMREGFARFLVSDAAQLITIDADLSHDPALVTRMLERVPPDGVVIGSRYLHGAPRADWAVARMLISILGNRYVRLITGLPVADCTSGFRCYTRAAIECLAAVPLRSRGYAFHVETLYWIWRAGAPLSEVPIVYRDRLVGESKLDLAIIAESLRTPWTVVWRDRAGRRRAMALPAPAPGEAAPRRAPGTPS
jgi:dolichol-phosphate mannosyltransferase